MERAASPYLRNTFSPITMKSGSMLRDLNAMNHSHVRRRLEFDDEHEPPSITSSSGMEPPVRSVHMTRGSTTAAISSVFQQQSTFWNHHQDNQVLWGNVSDHAKHSRTLDLSNHSQPTVPGGSILPPPGRRVDTGDDERLEAPTRMVVVGSDGNSFVEGGGWGGDDKSHATHTSLRSRSVMSRQQSLLSLDNLSVSTELHMMIQRQTSQSSVCSFASHALHKRRNSWGSTCGDSIAGAANIPPFLLRLTSASSANEGGSVTDQWNRFRHRSPEDDCTKSWISNVTNIRNETTTTSHVSHHLHQQHHRQRPLNPMMADALWLRQGISSRSLGSYTTITTTTTTRTTTNNVSPPLPSMLNMFTPKGTTTATPFPSPESPQQQEFTCPVNMGGNPVDAMHTGFEKVRPQPQIAPRNLYHPDEPQETLSMRYSPEQPPYYQAATICRTDFASKQVSAMADATLTSQQHYQPPLPLGQGPPPAPTPPCRASKHHSGVPYTTSGAMEEMDVDVSELP